MLYSGDDIKVFEINCSLYDYMSLANGVGVGLAPKARIRVLVARSGR